MAHIFEPAEFFVAQYYDEGPVFTDRDFRERLSVFQRDRSRDTEALRQTDTAKETLVVLESQDRERHIEEVALADYYDIVFADPPLDNPTTGNFDHAEWERGQGYRVPGGRSWVEAAPTRCEPAPFIEPYSRNFRSPSSSSRNSFLQI